MIIKSISIQNFRQYKNENTINFSTDPEKNVTVVLGVNTSGKTTLVQAFNWCLYETTTFKSRDMLLNSEIASSLPENGYAIVRVQIILEHQKQEYTIVRSQRFSKASASNKVRGDRSSLYVSILEPNGNTFTIKPYECQETINKILPMGLSDYFFFDGERIQDINNKKDVVSAVRGLMGLEIAKVAVDHLDPNKPGSVIRKLQSEIKGSNDQETKKYQNDLDKAILCLEDEKNRLDRIDLEIEYAKSERERMSEILRGTAEVRDLQKRRDELNRNKLGAESGVVESQERFLADFNRDYFSFFVQPLLGRAKKVLADSKKEIEGIPEMNAIAIDYILNRGRCICGCDLTKNQGAVENINYEKSLLPPNHIGTMIRSFNDTCNMILSQGGNASLKDIIISDYKNIRRFQRSLGEIIDELKIISEKISKLGPVNIAQMESDYKANEKTLENKLIQHGNTEANICAIQKRIEENKKRINEMSFQCKQNTLIRREIEYATAVYEWFKESYDKQETQIKHDLLEKVNAIFKKMYHGSRLITIDDNYHIQLITQVGEERITTDESKGLEAVKNFSFIAGLVELARDRARLVVKSPFSNEPDIHTAEPYPIVMDAPFSNVDEIHINNISGILPNIAEQVILIVMKKDWDYAEKTIGDKVGASYYIGKVDNSDTYSKIFENKESKINV